MIEHFLSYLPNFRDHSLEISEKGVEKLHARYRRGFFRAISKGRDRTALWPSLYRRLTLWRDVPSTLSHVGLTVLVMDNKVTLGLPLRRERAIFHSLFTF
jgi:hypothetical protein